jgi:hypothetical protein
VTQHAVIGMSTLGWWTVSFGIGGLLLALAAWAGWRLAAHADALDDEAVRRARLGVVLPLAIAAPPALAMSGAHAARSAWRTPTDLDAAISAAALATRQPSIAFVTVFVAGGCTLGLAAAGLRLRRGMQAGAATWTALAALLATLGMFWSIGVVDVLTGILMFFATTLWMWRCTPRRSAPPDAPAPAGAVATAALLLTVLAGGACLGAAMVLGGAFRDEAFVAVGVAVAASAAWQTVCAARMTTRSGDGTLSALSTAMLGVLGAAFLGVAGAGVAQVIVASGRGALGDDTPAMSAATEIVFGRIGVGLATMRTELALIGVAVLGLLIASRRSPEGDRPALGVAAAPAAIVAIAALGMRLVA